MYKHLRLLSLLLTLVLSFDAICLPLNKKGDKLYQVTDRIRQANNEQVDAVCFLDLDDSQALEGFEKIPGSRGPPAIQ